MRDLPLNGELFKWRRKAHKVMDMTWKSGLMSRTDLYRMLRRELKNNIHVSQCSVNECKQIIALFNPELIQQYE